MKVCGNCGVKDPKNICSECKRVFYCSTECQRKHWKEGGHKVVCKDLCEIIKKKGKAFEHVERISRANENKRSKIFSDGKIVVFRKDKRLYMEKFPDGSIKNFNGERGSEFICKITLPSGEIRNYTGEKGNERMDTVEFLDGSIQYYEGEKGNERRIRTKFPNGKEQFYEGDAGNEWLTELRLTDGSIQIYKGKIKGKESIDTIKGFVNNYVYHYKGDAGKENLVLATCETKDSFYRYKGKKGNEAICEKKEDGIFFFLEGKKGTERIVKVLKHFGQICYYLGERDSEYMVSEVLPMGQINYFKGPKEKEILVKTIFNDGTIYHFEGINECLRKIEYPDDRIEYYTGEPLKETLITV